MLKNQSDNNSSADDTDEVDHRGFFHAFGVIKIELATNYTNFHELNIHFVHVNALSRKRSLCVNS